MPVTMRGERVNKKIPCTVCLFSNRSQMVQPSWSLMFLQPSFPKDIFFKFVNFYQICSDSIHFLLKGCFKLHAEFLLIFSVMFGLFSCYLLF